MPLKSRLQRALHPSSSSKDPSKTKKNIQSNPNTHSHSHSPSISSASTGSPPRYDTFSPTPPLSPTYTNTSPEILSKTSSRLSKRLTWRLDKSASKSKPKPTSKSNNQPQQSHQTWEEWDRNTPIPTRKQGPHQDALRAFEWKWRSSMDKVRGRASVGSIPGSDKGKGKEREKDPRRVSAVSPGCSRVGSVDDGYVDGKERGDGKMGMGGEKRLSASWNEEPMAGRSSYEQQRGRSLLGREGAETVVEE